MKIILLCLIIISQNLNAQPNPGARMSAMAASGVAMADIWSVNANQAGLIALKRTSLALSYQKPFSGQTLSAQSAVFILPVKNQTWGISINRYGLDAYRDQQMSLTYARAFGPNLSAALGFRYQQLSIEQYGKTEAYGLDAGLRYQINPSLSLGAHLGNLSKNALSRELHLADQPLKIQFGAAYQSSEQVLLAMSLEKTLYDNPDARLGLEYQIIPLIALRGGLSLNPFRQYGGIGLSNKNIKLDLALAAHRVLGYGTQFGLAYAF